MQVFVFGMGYSGKAACRWVRALVSPDVPVFGTARSPEGLAEIAAQGFAPHAFDGTAPGMSLGPDLARSTHVIASIAPDAAGDPVLRHHAADLMAAPDLEWLCYYSTVGVYGDFGGAFIDEDAPTHPQNPRSQWRLAAERQWQEFAQERGVPLIIMRLAGIYGPGRSGFDKLRDGTAKRIVKPGQVFNRIHVEDIGRLTVLAAQQHLSGTFNLADDEPAPPQEVVAHAAALLGMPPPPEQPFETAEMTPMARSFYADNKRVANARIKAALGTTLDFPDYRTGLKAILDAENS